MFESGRGGWARLTVVVGFVFGGWDVSDGFEDPPCVEPVDVGEGGKFDVFEAAPGSLPVDEFGLVEADDRFGEAQSYESPTEPTDGSMPASARRSVYRILRYWVDSTGGRNTSIERWLVMAMFKHQQVAAVREMRGKMWSPGRPSTFRREHRVRFWETIARGLSTEDAAAEVGVSPAVGARWFREAGGMPSVELVPVSGRYLSFAEREEIAILNEQEVGVREIEPHGGGVHRAAVSSPTG